MTNIEASWVEESIKSETLCGKKLEVWRGEVQDPELRRLVEDAIQGCRRSADMLLAELRA